MGFGRCREAARVSHAVRAANAVRDAVASKPDERERHPRDMPLMSLLRSLFRSTCAAALFVVAIASCAARSRVVTTPTGLRYTVTTAGSGPVAVRGQRVTIHETTTLRSGTVIYTSRGSNPITFQLGANQVIAGVDEGVTGMRVGERRLLVVPPSLSKRTSYPANTPPDSTLHIDLELVAIRP